MKTIFAVMEALKCREHFERSLVRSEGCSAGGNTFSLKVTDIVSYIQYLIAFPTTAMDGGSAGFVYVHGWTVVGQCICTGRTVLGQCRSSEAVCRGAITEEQYTG